MNLSTNHNMRYPKDVVRHPDVMIKPNTHDNLQHSTVSYPSDPSNSLLLWEYGDVATFEVHEITLLAQDENCLLLSRQASSVLISLATSTYTCYLQTVAFFASSQSAHSLQVVKYGTCEKLDQYTHFFIPSGQSPVAGEMVTCIGYPGTLRTMLAF